MEMYDNNKKKEEFYKNILTILKENKYFKLYTRLIKNKKIYHNKEYMSITRLYDVMSNRINERTPNSIIFNMEIPNMLISTAITMENFINIYHEFNRQIIYDNISIIINTLIQTKNIKKNNKTKTNLTQSEINKIINKTIIDVNKKIFNFQENSYKPINKMIKQITNIIDDNIFVYTKNMNKIIDIHEVKNIMCNYVMEN